MSDNLQGILSRFDPDLPLERARTIPAAWYFDPELYAAECRAVFGDTWQAVGRADQVREPGQFFTADLAGEPVLVVRGDDGELRAFFNVCRHRAARVLPDAEGQGDPAALPLSRLDLRPVRPAAGHAGVRRRRRIPPRGQRPAAAWPSPPGGRSSGSTSARTRRR